MINGDVNDFVDRISYGDELIFTFHGRKYFLQGYHDLGGLWTTYRDRWEPPADDYIWVGKCDFHFPGIIKNESYVVGINGGGQNHHGVAVLRGKVEKCLEDWEEHEE